MMRTALAAELVAAELMVAEQKAELVMMELSLGWRCLQMKGTLMAKQNRRRPHHPRTTRRQLARPHYQRDTQSERAWPMAAQPHR